MQTLKRVLAGPWVPPDMGKLPYLWATSLAFLLFKYFYSAVSAFELAMLGISVLLFLPLYLFSFWAGGRSAVLCILAACLFGILWAPHNSGAGTFFIFAAGMCGRLAPGRNAPRMLALVLALATATGYLLAQNGIAFLLAPWAVGLSVGVASIMEGGLRASRRQLLRKQEEVEHIARIAERERISRDLHDLLGHSLSLIALKAELANKLAGRDLDACRREIADIESTARRALAEVRTAVTGYRDSGLPGALASARASLAAAGVALREEVQPQFHQGVLAPAIEHVLALALREAVTNVVRHAGATRCTVRLALEEGSAVLGVCDDGRRLRAGDEVRVGNGLTGMRERAAGAGGELSIGVDEGLRLELRLPIKETEGETA
ncbi:histidine kinase [Massilia sp. WF1]|uniref:sensor histidine kinase n=1 Tax=unclassified Massilia TaxID=2609279 RepID=UPI00069188AE|nr:MULTISPECIES: sensor histidine kinase [unclassified Massilia]ALK95755.1 histidine kinase [Massilia sp. WG5]KNZ68026.1 histidine kinase [Massilia sp. WF1]